MSFAVIQGSSKGTLQTHYLLPLLIPYLHYQPGIGLALTRHLLQNTSLRVVATTSQKNANAIRDSALSGLDIKNDENRLTTLPLDVTDEASIGSARDEILEKMGRNMRLLVNVSGVVRLTSCSSLLFSYHSNL